MIQFNLLPDVKKEYVKAKRTRRLIMSFSFILSAASIAILVVLFSVVQIGQKKHINDQTKDIEVLASEIASTEDINQVLTIQNQLLLLPDLHTTKPETSRVFGYVKFISPEQLKVQSLNIDMESTELVLEGTADAIATINRFVDNIKATRFIVDAVPDATDVVKLEPFSSVNTELSGNNELATFRVNLVFNPEIFDNTKVITMVLADQAYKSSDSGAQ